ncbi:MAG TPA: hypothetical protein VMA98_11705 [Candidatus Acidoferrales bacterium]|nr:hypothetical protein [Candidatus Acidoferrales bacterium]
MKRDLEHPSMNLPRSQDEAFRAGLWGAPFCDVDEYEVAMITQGTTPYIPSRPTLFVVVDFIGPHQEKYLRMYNWAYDEKLEWEECYRMGRVLRFLFWAFDCAGLTDSRAFVIGKGLLEGGRMQVEKYRLGKVGDRYDSRKLVTHIRRLIEQTSDFKSVNRKPSEIEKDLIEYAHREQKTKPAGPFSMTVETGEVFKKWTKKPGA